MSRFGQFQVLKRERKRDEEIVKKMLLKTCQKSKAIKKCPACLCPGFSLFLIGFWIGTSIHLFVIFLHFYRT